MLDGRGWDINGQRQVGPAQRHNLGHRNIQHIIRSTELANSQFEGWWE